MREMWNRRQISTFTVPTTKYLVLSTFLVASLFANTATAAPKVLHVSPAGSDKAAGTAVKPLKSLQKALELAATGDTIELAAGNYTGEVKTRVSGVTISGRPGASVSSPGNRGIEVLHDKTVIRGITIEKCDIGIWVYGANDCLLEDLTVRDIGGEGIRIKNQSCNNTVRQCDFQRMGREGFDVAAGKKNGEGVYIGTAPEQRGKNTPPDVPDRCTGNLVEDCTFATEAAEAVDMKEDSEENIVRRCTGTDSRDPDGPIFGSRGDKNRFEDCVATGGQGHGFRFGGDTVKAGQHGQKEARTYGVNNVMRNCRAEKNALWGAAPMVQPQDIDASNQFAENGKGAVRK
jgi:parallel beta-helix repeat protein